MGIKWINRVTEAWTKRKTTLQAWEFLESNFQKELPRLGNREFSQTITSSQWVHRKWHCIRPVQMGAYWWRKVHSEGSLQDSNGPECYHWQLALEANLEGQTSTQNCLLYQESNAWSHLTEDNLKRRKLQIVNKCHMCNMEAETHSHPFLQCPVVQTYGTCSSIFLASEG